MLIAKRIGFIVKNQQFIISVISYFQSVFSAVLIESRTAFSKVILATMAAYRMACSSMCPPSSVLFSSTTTRLASLSRQRMSILRRLSSQSPNSLLMTNSALIVYTGKVYKAWRLMKAGEDIQAVLGFCF